MYDPYLYPTDGGTVPGITGKRIAQRREVRSAMSENSSRPFPDRYHTPGALIMPS